MHHEPERPPSLRMNARTTDVLTVFQGDLRAGELARTRHGARFTYAPEYLACAASGIAYKLPPRAEPYEVLGANLHPFFANLLPEGVRMHALVGALKTDADDLFSQLAASGVATIGDVVVARGERRPPARRAFATLDQLAHASFAELFADSLRYEDGRGDFAIAGVQPKLSVCDGGRASILKLPPPELPRLVENEAFFMHVAENAGMRVARTRVVHDRLGQAALLVERFDRTYDGAWLHQEDACQLLDHYPADKYQPSLRDVSDALEVCTEPAHERLELLRMQTFSYLIANGDLHAKNVSVRRVGARVELTPCYDLLSTLPYGDRSLALAIDGRDDELTRAHLLSFGERIGLSRDAVATMIDVLCEHVSAASARVSEIGLPHKQTEQLQRLMRARLGALAP
ncbi:MAG TPA: HipA domain-containing protein [Polyangiales bacterium]